MEGFANIEACPKKKRGVLGLAGLLSKVFGILAICGVVYVLANAGKVSAGYAVVPAVLSVAFNMHSRSKVKIKRGKGPIN